MKKLFILASLCLFALSSFEQIKLFEETPLKIKIIKEISSKKSQVGDIIYFKVIENLKADSIVIIDTSAEVIGEVIEAEKARSLGRPGKLDFAINTVKAVDGQYIKLRASEKKITGKNKTGGVIAAAVIFAPIALFIKGKDVTVENDKEFIVYVDKDYTIKSN